MPDLARSSRHVKEPRGSELVSRYIANYGELPDGEITEEMVLRHWSLERELTAELLRSRPDERWQVFAGCYTRLYNELDWLNRQSLSESPAAKSFARIIDLIGPDDKKIYEIGSGKAALISHLASCGYECKATEITPQRGQKLAVEHPNLCWGTTDGVHLRRFEQEDYWDVVLSCQLIEHLHPDDLLDHLKGVHAILAPGGRYILSTEHRYTGPHDLSRVFCCDVAKGMHLKEYTYRSWHAR